MKIIVKADDLAGYPGRNKVVPTRWQQFVDIIEKYSIKASIGIIGNSLIFDDEEYFAWIEKYDKLGFIEFFNHGFLHRQFNFDAEVYQEFKNSSLEYQQNLIQYTNKLLKDKVGIEFVTFGAPYNAVDKDTSKALNLENMKYGFFLKEGFNGINLEKRLEVEVPVHCVNLQNFKEQFVQQDYAVLQTHPNSWDKKNFDDFEQIIQFLLDKKVKFVLPKEF